MPKSYKFGTRSTGEFGSRKKEAKRAKPSDKDRPSPPRVVFVGALYPAKRRKA